MGSICPVTAAVSRSAQSRIALGVDNPQVTADPRQDWRAFAVPTRVDVTPVAAPPARPPGGGHHAIRAPFLVVAVALIACVSLLRLSGLTPTSAAQALSSPAADQVVGSIGRTPPVHHVADPIRIAPAVTPPPGAGGWVPLTGTMTHPIRWDPCQPIRYVIAG